MTGRSPLRNEGSHWTEEISNKKVNIYGYMYWLWLKLWINIMVHERGFIDKI
jgi:hypothetical protein